jgi:hypothetical protein
MEQLMDKNVVYLYPTSYKLDRVWDTLMIENWIASKKKYLSFAFKRFFPETLPRENFWLFLYYTKNRTEIADYRGRARYRFHVINWASQPFENESTYCRHTDDTARVWFLVDRYQEVQTTSSKMFAFEDFRHPEGKLLGSCMRSSITPAICEPEIQIIGQYPL